MIDILLLQGANMNWLGKREPELYGTTSAAELNDIVLAHAKTLGLSLDIFYTNTEGTAIDRIYQAAQDGVAGLVMNPAGFTYGGFALRDCLRAVRLPYVEVHMTNIERRGTRSLTMAEADGVIIGLGVDSYRLGLDAIVAVLNQRPTV